MRTMFMHNQCMNMLTTKQAVERAQVSRFVLMRAHKCGELHPVRSNDRTGSWMWDSAELDLWSAHREPSSKPSVQEKSDPSELLVSELRERAQRAEQRAEQAEHRLSELALELARATSRRRKFWPFG